MVRNGHKRSHIIANSRKRSQTVADGRKLSQMVANGRKRSQIVADGRRRSHTVANGLTVQFIFSHQTYSPKFPVASVTGTSSVYYPNTAEIFLYKQWRPKLLFFSI